MIRTAALLLAIASATATASDDATATPPAAHPERSVRGADAESKGEAALGLSKTSVFDVPTPPAVKLEDSSPGEKPALPRVYPGAPPVIPHGIADLLPITRDQNLCLDCHAVKVKRPGEATPIPASHYRDLRRAPGTPRKQIAGARHVCTACHATRSDAAPLVGNEFGR